jgi:hypothetical protein
MNNETSGHSLELNIKFSLVRLKKNKPRLKTNVNDGIKN